MTVKRSSTSKKTVRVQNETSADTTAGPIKRRRSLREIVKEPSTVAGVLAILSQALLAGPGALTNPGVWAGVMSGFGLILTREG